MKKLLYLFLALLLPGLIFIFLKFAGRNEFAIPIYYQESVSDSLKGCGFDYPVPYHVPDTLWKGSETIFNANIFVFSESGFDGHKLKSDLDEELGPVSLSWTTLSERTKGPTDLEKWKCTFLIRAPWQVVLVDEQGRIRGYYDPRLREELDRLRVELKVLLKKY